MKKTFLFLLYLVVSIFKAKFVFVCLLCCFGFGFFFLNLLHNFAWTEGRRKEARKGKRPVSLHIESWRIYAGRKTY